MSRRINRKNSDSPPVLIHEAITDVELPPRNSSRMSKKTYDEEVTKALIADTINIKSETNNRPKGDRNLKRKLDGTPQDEVYDESKENSDITPTPKSDSKNVSFSVQLSDYARDDLKNQNSLPAEYLDLTSLLDVALLRKVFNLSFLIIILGYISSC